MKTDPLDRDVTRLESFSDAVFGVVATLLVVSLDVPTAFSQLLDRLAGFPGFAVGFLVLTMFWARHRTFFRRFGHYDTGVLFANAVLLFSLVFFVFPFKWITNLVLSRFLGLDLGSGAPLTLHTFDEARSLMMLFSGGFTAVFASFLLLYLSAWRHRDVLAPGPAERALLRLEVQLNAIAAAMGIVALVLCGFGVGLTTGLPLWLLLLLVPFRWWQERRSRKVE